MGMFARVFSLAILVLFVAGSSVMAETFPSTSTSNPPDEQSFAALKATQSTSQSNMAVSPSALTVTLPTGQQLDRTLTISNTGATTLNTRLQVISGTTTWQPLVFPSQKVAPELRARNAIAANSQSDMLIYLKEQADLSGAYRISDWKARGQYVYNTLFTTAQRTQSSLLQQLNGQIEAGVVTSYEPFYIVNAVLIRARTATLTALAARSDVAYIDAAHTHSLPQPARLAGTSATPVEWGVAKIRADQVWNDFDDRGEGVVVASIDSGVMSSHPALAKHYRGMLTGSNDYNWFDPTGTHPTSPDDNVGHGTHTMGIMVGDDGGSNHIGVAPGATWIAAKGCSTTTCADANLLAAAQWVLAPFPIGGKPANGDASKRPNIVNNSWGGYGGIPWYASAVQAWRAADIFPAFVAGNFGPGDGTIGSPGDYAQSFATGATDSSDQIASFSARGPSLLTDETKPDVTAPGVDIRSSMNDGGYGFMSGTSMASPHTAGCVALMLSAAPNLDLDTIEQLLTSTATDLGNAGPDTSYGYGRIDCYAAVAAARSYNAWLTLNATTAVVWPGSSQDVIVHFDTTRLTAGTYQAQINISNYPDGHSVTVPVTLIVPQGPTLAIPNSIPARSGEMVHVPIGLTSNGFSVTRVAFSITYDRSCLMIDPDDADGDDDLDAISFSLPSQFLGTAHLISNDTSDTITVTITRQDQTLATLTDGVLASATLRTTCQPISGESITAPITFAGVPAISFNASQGVSVSGVGTTNDGSVRIEAAPLNPTELPPPSATEETTPTEPTGTPAPPPGPTSGYEIYLPNVQR